MYLDLWNKDTSTNQDSWLWIDTVLYIVLYTLVVAKRGIARILGWMGYFRSGYTKKQIIAMSNETILELRITSKWYH